MSKKEKEKGQVFGEENWSAIMVLLMKEQGTINGDSAPASILTIQHYLTAFLKAT